MGVDEQFPSTHWSLIRAARARSTSESRKALSHLCEAYWPPIYAFLRRRGENIDSAQELTQSFFKRLIEKQVLDHAHPDGGRFRSFLLASVKNMVLDEKRRAAALKRGGGQAVFSLDTERAEQILGVKWADHHTPDVVYERTWALTVLQAALRRLQNAYVASDNRRMFDALRPYLTGEHPARTYRQVGEDLSLSESAVKMTVNRMRKRLGRYLREEVAQTIDDPAEVNDEVRHLLQVLRDMP